MVHPAQEGWLTNLHNLMEKYFRYQCMIYHLDNSLLCTQEWLSSDYVDDATVGAFNVWKLCSFRYEIRTSVRAKVLSSLSSVLTSYGHWYEVRFTNLPLQGFLHNSTCHDTSPPFPLEYQWNQRDGRCGTVPQRLLKEDWTLLPLFNNSIANDFYCKCENAFDIFFKETVDSGIMFCNDQQFFLLRQ